MLSDFFAWLRELDQLLVETGRLWQFRCFDQRDYPWQTTHPLLAQALDNLDASELAAFESDSQLAWQWGRGFIPQLDRLRQLSRLPVLQQRSLTIPERFEVGIPGRKWQQVQAFLATIPETQQSTLEWCAGKGHLGRLLAQTQNCLVSSLEWNQELCRAGTLLGQKLAVTQQFLCCDALAAEAAQQLHRHQRVLALHACGDLHGRLLQQWAASSASSLYLAPCCYHLVGEHDYQPFSVAGRNAGLRITRGDLKLPMQELVTGGRRAQRLRRRQLQWRLAFDEWQRQQRQEDTYMSLPAPPQSMLSGSFSAFMRWACERKRIPLPLPQLQEQLLLQGGLRSARVRRMEIVSHLFRRPLEIWLVLDRALALREAGAWVQIGEFCDYRLTPRNSLIAAIRP